MAEGKVQDYIKVLTHTALEQKGKTILLTCLSEEKEIIWKVDRPNIKYCTRTVKINDDSGASY